MSCAHSVEGIVEQLAETNWHWQVNLQCRACLLWPSWGSLVPNSYFLCCGAVFCVTGRVLPASSFSNACLCVTPFGAWCKHCMQQYLFADGFTWSVLTVGNHSSWPHYIASHLSWSCIYWYVNSLILILYSSSHSSASANQTAQSFDCFKIESYLYPHVSSWVQWIIYYRIMSRPKETIVWGNG